MSKSRKKVAIVKDKTGRWYNKVIRRRQNQEIRKILTLADIMDYNISHPYEIVNQYDICDWVYNFEGNPDWETKIKRK